MLRFLITLFVKLFLSYLLIFLRLCSVLIVLSLQEKPEIVTGPLNGCSIVLIWSCPLDYTLRFPTKLLVKIRFGDFWIFFRLYSPLTIFASLKQKKQKIITGLWKRCSQSYLFCLKYHVKVFNKIISSVIFVIFAIIFKNIFSLDNVFTSKTPYNCHRSLK